MYLYRAGYRFDDVRNDRMRLFHAAAREERGVVVVPAELADDEERPAEEVPALCKPAISNSVGRKCVRLF